MVMVIGLPGRVGYDFLCGVFTGHFTNACWTDQFQPAIRMFSTLGQPNWLGAYLVIHFFIALYFIIHSYGKKQILTLLFIGYSLLNFTALLFTRSRSALLALGIGMFVALIYIFSSKKELVRPVFYFIVLMSVPLFIFKTGIGKIAGSSLVTSSQAIPSSITDSADIRKIVWRGAWDLALKYPWFGTGVETFAYSYNFTRPLAHNQTSEWDFIYNKAHNEYLNYGATTGFVGLGTYLGFIIILVWNVVRKLKVKSQKSKVHLKYFDNVLYVLLFLSWVSILITNFFGFSTSTINLFFFLIPAFFIILVGGPDHQNKTPKVSPLFQWQKGALLMSIFVFTVLVIFFVTYFIADIFYARAQENIRQDRYDKAVNLLDQALSIHYEHVYQDKLSSYLATEAYLTSYQKDNTATQKLMVRADEYNRSSLQASYHNMFYWRTKAKNYFLFYQMTSSKKYLNESIGAFNHASELASTDPKSLYMKALVYSYVYNEEKDKKLQATYKDQSLETIERVIQLKNNYRDAYFLKGQLLKKYGRKDDARGVFEYMLKNINPTDEEVMKELEK